MRLVEEADGRRQRAREDAAQQLERRQQEGSNESSTPSGGKRSLATWHAPDSYAFGVVLWELLTLEQPWEGMGANEMWLRVQRGERPALTAADVDGAPEGYVALMRELWHQDPVARPTFAEALQRLRVMLVAETNVAGQKEERSNATKRLPEVAAEVGAKIREEKDSHVVPEDCQLHCGDDGAWGEGCNDGRDAACAGCTASSCGDRGADPCGCYPGSPDPNGTDDVRLADLPKHRLVRS